MKATTLRRIIALALIILSVITLFAACKVKPIPTVRNESANITEYPERNEVVDNSNTSKGDEITGDQSFSASVTAQPQRISKEEAERIALEHAGIIEPERIHSEFDEKEYDVEFIAKGIEYEYEIGAYSGEVRSADSEKQSFWD